MKRSSKRGKRQKKFLADERFATKVIVAIGITTVIFIAAQYLSLIHISEPTRQAEISYAVFCLKKKKNNKQTRLGMIS